MMSYIYLIITVLELSINLEANNNDIQKDINIMKTQMKEFNKELLASKSRKHAFIVRGTPICGQ